jgi:hypothetical protein
MPHTSKEIYPTELAALIFHQFKRGKSVGMAILQLVIHPPLAQAQ